MHDPCDVDTFRQQSFNSCLEGFAGFLCAVLKMQCSGFSPRQRNLCPHGQATLFGNVDNLALKIKVHGKIMGQHHFQHQQSQPDSEVRTLSDFLKETVAEPDSSSDDGEALAGSSTVQSAT